MKAIKNAKLILKDSIVKNKILLFNDKIIDIADSIDKRQDIEWIDAKGNYISPGFIDIHIHGAFNHDTMDEADDNIRCLSKSLCQNGVTGFLPTTVSDSKDKIHRTLNKIRQHMHRDAKQAKVLGAHLEGPFINPVRKGAHNDYFIIKPDYELVRDYLDVVKIITMAPELDKNFSFINKIIQNKNTVLSIGHSDATYEEAIKSIEAGIKSATHIFNAMSGLNHRNPGVVGAVLNSGIYCELIADKVHVHQELFELLIKLKGIDKVILITDSISAACMKKGTYELGGLKVFVDDTSARLADNTLAGSILTINKAVKNMWENTKVELYKIVRMVSLNPAELLGLDNSLGSIEKGKQADITVFDEDLNIKATFINGETAFMEGL